MSKMKLGSALVASVPAAAIVILSFVICFFFVSLDALSILFFFNVLFLSFTFRLNGTLKRKIALLAFGNFLGLAWNSLLTLTVRFGFPYLGESFAILFRILFPFLNSVWVVSFWSWSLSAFSNSELKHAEGG